jgi:hypothetical protein
MRGRPRWNGLVEHLYLLSARLAPQRARKSGETTPRRRGTFLGARVIRASVWARGKVYLRKSDSGNACFPANLKDNGIQA